MPCKAKAYHCKTCGKAFKGSFKDAMQSLRKHKAECKTTNKKTEGELRVVAFDPKVLPIDFEGKFHSLIRLVPKLNVKEIAVYVPKKVYDKVKFLYPQYEEKEGFWAIRADEGKTVLFVLED